MKHSIAKEEGKLSSFLFKFLLDYPILFPHLKPSHYLIMQKTNALPAFSY